MEFENKRQLNTFVIYERACNLLFSKNGIKKTVTSYADLNIHIKNVQLPTRNTTNVTNLTDFSRALFARAYCCPISRY